MNRTAGALGVQGLLLLLLTLAVPACGSGNASRRGGADDGDSESARGLEGGTQGEDRCQADANHEVSEYDTSGDEYPDVRKVFLRVGEAPVFRLVLVCREADLNADGVKDVVRYYNDEGRPAREEADRDFDGQMDEVIFFEDGRIVRMEQDTAGNGRVDTKIFYEQGRPLRAERDLAGRSTATTWQPDRWEYYEEGRMVRAGSDMDGDGRVDRWDRDEEWREQQRDRANEEAADAREEEVEADE